MLGRTVSLILSALLAAASIGVGVGSQTAAHAASTAGPPYDFRTEIVDNFVVVPLRDAARILRSEHGYVYEAGKQDSHLVLRRVDRGLRLADSGTKEFRQLPRACREVRAKVGVAAVCRIPAGVTVRQPLLVEVWPRLGDDYVNSTRLPASFAVSFLADLGNDVARYGPGPDFFNGAGGNDRVFGGGGNDWLRTGLDNDTIVGGPGDDQLVGVDGVDRIYGGEGNDRVGGGNGDDWLQGDGGADFMVCGTGRDTATVDGADRLADCEALRRG